MLRRVLIRRTGLRGTIVAAAALGAAMLAAPAPALAATGNLTCTTQIIGIVITGNVTVPAGATCLLSGDPVQGNVAVGDGAQAIVTSDTVEGSVSVGEGVQLFMSATYIQRNLSTEGAFAVFVDETVVDGNTSFDATSDNLSICGPVDPCVSNTYNFGTPNPNPNGPANKFGNVSITNTSAPGGAVYVANYVAGNLSCSGNTSVTNLGYPNTVLGQESGQCAGL